MNHLIIYAHPNPKSFCASLFEHIASLSKDLGNSVTVRDLYKLKFNPVLDANDFTLLKKGSVPKDIKTEQEHIQNADLITLLFPLWWTGYPAILKGWIDRVLQNGFAFKYSRDKGATPLLGGKKIQLILTMGATVDEYEERGLMDAMAITMGDNVWGYCGCTDAGMVVLSDIPGMSDQERNQIFSEIEDTLVLAMASEQKKAKAKSPAKKSKATSSSKKPSKKKTARPGSKKR